MFMKKIKKLSLIFLFVLTIFFINACDPCSTVNCINGECVEGDCICNTGYEGDECEKEMREKFLGSYIVSDECEAEDRNSHITEHPQEVTYVYISTFLNNVFGGKAEATIHKNIISIPEQLVYDNDNDPWIVAGLSTGTFSDGSFQIDVKYSYGTFVENCKLIFKKE